MSRGSIGWVLFWCHSKCLVKLRIHISTPCSNAKDSMQKKGQRGVKKQDGVKIQEARGQEASQRGGRIEIKALQPNGFILDGTQSPGKLWKINIGFIQLKPSGTSVEDYKEVGHMQDWDLN